MGEKDIAEKILASFNDVFADIVNGLVFDGRPVVSEADLADATPMGYYKASGKVHEQARDIAKRWMSRDVCISLIGMENQTRPDRYMPIRTMMYDAVGYQGQLPQPGKRTIEYTDLPQHRSRKKFYAVISLVLYLGYEERWCKPRSLRELVNRTIPTELDALVQDYRIHLYEIAWMTPEEVNRRFHSDFRILANYLVQKRQNQDYIPDTQTMRHAREVLHLLSLIERDHRYEDVYNDLVRDDPSGEEGAWNMCDVLDKAINKGHTAGLAEGHAAGLAEGVQKERRENARGMRAIGMTLDQIAAVLRTDVPSVTKMLQ